MQIITKLKQAGCRVIDRETTEGAMKWWLTHKLTKQQVLAAAELTSTEELFGEFLGDGFTLQIQSPTGIFVAKPRRTQAGREYQRGIDC